MQKPQKSLGQRHVFSTYLKIFWIILFSGAFFFHGVINASADFKFEWQTHEFDKDSYQDLYLYKLDLHELLVEYYDEEDDSTSLRGLDQATVDDIVSLFHRNFSYRLQKIIPLNADQEIDKSKNSLVVELTLKAKFTSDDPGLLTKLLIKPQKQPTAVMFEAVVTEAKTGKTVLEISDKKYLDIKNPEAPMTGEEDFQQFRELVEFWAKSFTLVLKEGK